MSFEKKAQYRYFNIEIYKFTIAGGTDVLFLNRNPRDRLIAISLGIAFLTFTVGILHFYFQVLLLRILH